jgi:peptidyl-prolyl cis-trans isomerase SurA
MSEVHHYSSLITHHVPLYQEESDFMLLKIAQITACLFLLFCTLMAYAKIVDGIIAYVNDDVITQGDLNKLLSDRIAELQQVYRFSRSEANEKAQQERSDLLDKLIRQILVTQEAQKEQIQVGEDEIDEYIKTLQKQFGIQSNEDFVEQLKREGFTLATFREKARKDLMGERLVQIMVLPKVDIVDDEITKFFEENREKFTTKPDRVHLRIIFVKFKLSDEEEKTLQQKVDTILKEVRSVDFAELARKYSDDERTKENGGYLGQFTNAELEFLPKPIQQVVAKLEVGQVTEPIEAQDGLYILKLEAKDEDSITLRNIFIALQAGQQSKDDAQKLMDEIRSRLESGDDFAELAAEYSDDAETKEQGGDLSFRGLEQFPYDIRTVIEALKEGQVSQTVEAPFGLYIFKLEKREPAQLTDEEKKQIRSILKQQKFESEWEKFTDKLKKKAFVKIK